MSDTSGELTERVICPYFLEVSRSEPASYVIAYDDLREWLANGLLSRILWLLAIEFALAVLSDVLGRTVSLLDSLLSERFSTAT